MLIRIEVKNWDKYNPRSDRQSTQWYRFQANFFSDPKVFDLDHEEKIVLVYVLCEVCGGAGAADININLASALLKIPVNKTSEALEKLKTLDIIEMTPLGVSLTPDGAGVTPRGVEMGPTDRQTNRQTNRQTIPPNGGDLPPPTQLNPDDADREPREGSKATEADLSLADSWFDLYRERFPNGKPPNVRQGADVIRKLREIDGHSEEEIRDALAFVREDDFWRENAVSPAGLRQKSKNGLTKFQNIVTKMRSQKATQQEPFFDPTAGQTDLSEGYW